MAQDAAARGGELGVAEGIRVGAVAYLNALPLIRGLAEDPGLSVEGASPAELARRLAHGELDVALLPTVELLRQPGLEVVPGIGIAAEGPVESVLLGHRCPPSEIRSLALDPHSRTSQVLCRIVLADGYGARPRTREAQPELAWSAGEDDGVLVIGDLALHMRRRGFPHLDLAEEWRRQSGLPMVFAVWAAAPGVLARHPGLGERLRAARECGLREVDRIVAEAVSSPLTAAELRVYLTERIRYRLAAREEAGLRRFLERAADFLD